MSAGYPHWPLKTFSCPVRHPPGRKRGTIDVAYTPDQQEGAGMARSARDVGVPAAEDTRDPDILTTEELGAGLGVELRPVRDLGAPGFLPGARAGRRWLFS